MLTLKSKCYNLTLGQGHLSSCGVPDRSSSYQSMRLGERNTLGPTPLHYLYSIKSQGQRTHLTSYDLERRPQVTDIKIPRHEFCRYWCSNQLLKVPCWPLENCSHRAIANIFVGWVTWADLVTWPEMTLGWNISGRVRKELMKRHANNWGAARRRFSAIREKLEGEGLLSDCMTKSQKTRSQRTNSQKTRSQKDKSQMAESQIG